MHSQCYAICALSFNFGGARLLFYVTKFLHVQCTRNSRESSLVFFLVRMRGGKGAGEGKEGKMCTTSLIMRRRQTYIR